ncbi:MAG: tetratricopeptide repeat protein [Bacteriovoracaceae bacterium]|nr:tetratricopeptide repeat protein [Bacteriovoracaceae bacterium]
MEVSQGTTESTGNLNQIDTALSAAIHAPIDGSLDEEFAKLASSRKEQGEGFYKLAKLYYDKCDMEKALEYFELSKKYIILPENFFGLVKIYGFTIRIYSEKQKMENAQAQINELALLMDRAPTILPQLKSEYFFYLGALETYKKNQDKAIEYFLSAHQKSREENEPEILAKCLYSLGQSYFQKGENTKALRYLEQLRELLQILKKYYLLGSMHILLGKIYNALGQYTKSLEHFKFASFSLQKKTYWNLYGYALLGEGVVYKNMGEFNKALIYFEWGLSLFDQSNFRRLSTLIKLEIEDVNDSNVDLYLDRNRRLVMEKSLGTIDFKHRFVLLEILFLLAQNPGIYFNKDDLAKSIWRDEYNPLIHDKLIYTSVSRLRKLIEPKDDKRKYLLRGKDGYTFNPHVKIRFNRNQEIHIDRAQGFPEICTPV